METTSGVVRPFWRAVIGGGFGLAIGAVAAFAGSLWLVIPLAILVVLGGALGVLLISGD